MRTKFGWRLLAVLAVLAGSPARAGSKPDAVRLIVYTNTLKQFIRAGNDMLDVPDVHADLRQMVHEYRQRPGRPNSALECRRAGFRSHPCWCISGYR